MLPEVSISPRPVLLSDSKMRSALSGGSAVTTTKRETTYDSGFEQLQIVRITRFVGRSDLRAKTLRRTDSGLPALGHMMPGAAAWCHHREACPGLQVKS